MYDHYFYECWLHHIICHIPFAFRISVYFYDIGIQRFPSMLSTSNKIGACMHPMMFSNCEFIMKFAMYVVVGKGFKGNVTAFKYCTSVLLLSRNT